MSLAFCALDGLDADRLDGLCTLCRRLSMVRVDVTKRIDFLVVHRNTDAPSAGGPLTPQMASAVMGAGGIFAEYTGGPVPWQVVSQGHVFGNYGELITRLQRMNEPASIMELRRTLQESTADIDAEVETVAALAVLCQGYLATHAADDGLPVVIPSDELYDTCQAALKAMGWEALCRTMGDCGTRRGDLAQHRSELVKPSYWADVFDHQRPTLTTIAGKLRTSPTAIQRLLDFIWDGDSVRADVQSNPVPALAVAEAYLEMIEILPQIGLPK